MKIYTILIDTIEGENFIIKEFTNGRINETTNRFTGSCKELETSGILDDIVVICMNDKTLDNDAFEFLESLDIIKSRGYKENQKSVYSFNLHFFRYYLNQEIIKYEENMSIIEFLMDNTINERTLL